MHSKHKALAVMALGAILTACGSDAIAPPAAPAAIPTTPLARALVANGFAPDHVVEVPDGFIVEQDILLPRETVDRWIAELPTGEPGLRPQLRKQWSTNVLVDQVNVHEIRVDLSPLSGSAWEAPARQALTDWNAITTSRVYFVEGAPAELTVRFGYPGGIALASFPNGSPAQPGATITVDNAYAYWGTESQRRFVMAHELGHTVGLRHTNWNVYVSPTCTAEGVGAGANLIAGTNATDASSVMNKCTGGNNWNGFSAGDLTATRTLYPGPANVAASISGSSNVSTAGNKSWTANVTGGWAPYSYVWEMRDFCEDAWTVVGTGQTYGFYTSGEAPLKLRVRVTTPFKGQTVTGTKSVGFRTCGP